ncbi:hypothetical protein, partial [Cereibacter sphaeroides]|uniref:hypothetical protein n=1 Tax=Cereibacter sphaeroides TaxID=1063 RepID=UPI001F2D3C2D
MKKILLASLLLGLGAGAALSDDITDQLPEGSMKPANLSDLGSAMTKRVTDIVSGDVTEESQGPELSEGVSLFAGTSDEDPNILEIKRVARELDSQRAVPGLRRTGAGNRPSRRQR